MILIPIGRDEAEIRRHAFVSYVIIALNLLVFVATESATRTSRVFEIQQSWTRMGQYLMEHPYLRVPPEVAPKLNDEARAYLTKTRETLKRTGGMPPPFVVEREQAVLDKLAAAAYVGSQSLPQIRYGYVPADANFTDLVASMFIHAGLLHLLGNLIFFFVSGPFVEDVFGRPLFAALYITGGFAASLTYATRHPEGTIPLVGASGAIAAVMGAYLVRFLTSRVEFLFVPFIWRPMWHFRFFLPAFVVLPLWFIQQWLEMQGESGGGVAFSAHVGGFLYGVAVALVVKVTGFEEKFVNPKVVQETTWTMDQRTLAAMEAVRSAQAMDNHRALDTAATQLLARYVDEKQSDLALDLIQELTANDRARLPKFFARAAAFLERSGDREWALGLYRRLVDLDPNDAVAMQSLVKIGTLLRVSGDVTGARESLAKARAHPACTGDWIRTIDAKLTALRT
jgi:membrane associated rhomboid family serine protease